LHFLSFYAIHLKFKNVIHREGEWVEGKSSGLVAVGTPVTSSPAIMVQLLGPRIGLCADEACCADGQAVPVIRLAGWWEGTPCQRPDKMPSAQCLFPKWVLPVCFSPKE
jgi:hypothetical protein